jgi:hypothetical protein
MDDIVDVGETVIRKATYLDEDGDPIDPSIVTAYVKSPDADSVEVDVLHDVLAVGVYTFKVVPDAPGRWRYRFESDLETAEEEQGAFNVRRRRVPEPT